MRSFHRECSIRKKSFITSTLLSRSCEKKKSKRPHYFRNSRREIRFLSFLSFSYHPTHFTFVLVRLKMEWWREEVECAILQGGISLDQMLEYDLDGLALLFFSPFLSSLPYPPLLFLSISLSLQQEKRRSSKWLFSFLILSMRKSCKKTKCFPPSSPSSGSLLFLCFSSFLSSLPLEQLNLPFYLQRENRTT